MSKITWSKQGALCLMLTAMIGLNSKPALAADIKTNDELASWVCETRTERDCSDAKKFMKVIESRKPANRMRKQLSGTAALVGEVQLHYSKKTKVIYVQYEDTGSSTYEKAQTTYTRSSAFGSWKKSE